MAAVDSVSLCICQWRFRLKIFFTSHIISSLPVVALLLLLCDMNIGVLFYRLLMGSDGEAQHWYCKKSVSKSLACRLWPTHGFFNRRGCPDMSDIRVQFDIASAHHVSHLLFGKLKVEDDEHWLYGIASGSLALIIRIAAAIRESVRWPQSTVDSMQLCHSFQMNYDVFLLELLSLPRSYLMPYRSTTTTTATFQTGQTSLAQQPAHILMSGSSALAWGARQPRYLHRESTMVSCYCLF